MSLIWKNIFKEPLSYAIQIYTANIVPRLTKKNKLIGISIAISIFLFSLIRDKTRPPKNLRHIPYFGYASLIQSLLKGESLFSRGARLHVPYTNRTTNSKLYLEPERGKWNIHVTEPKDVKYLLFNHEKFPVANFRAGIEHTLFSKYIGGPNLLFSTGSDRKAQKSVISPAFRRSMPVKLFGEITQEVFEAIDKMGPTVDVSDLMTRCTLDAIGRAGFGFDFKAVTNPKNNKWTSLYVDITEGFGDIKFSFFPSLERFLWLFPKRKALHQKLDTFLDLLDEIIQQKRNLLERNSDPSSLEENEKDLLSLMIESEKKDEGGLSNLQLKANVCLFLFAGHDTTASSITSVLYYLGKYPEIQQRAREEAIAILGDEPTDVLPTAQDILKMKYIHQVIKETLRIADPAPKLFPRVAEQDTVLSDTFVPKGSRLVVNAYNVHHSEKYWENADQFNPDRFELDQKENMHWLPFGDGARICIGMNFSLNEQRVILSMMLRKYTWTVPENSIHKNGLVTSGVTVISPDTVELNICKIY